MHRCRDAICAIVALRRQRSDVTGCNMNATSGWAFIPMSWLCVPMCCAAIASLSSVAYAQDVEASSGPRSDSSRTVSTLSFLGGAIAGLAAHEGGHLFFDVVFDAEPGFQRVEFAGVPFFAVTHRPGLSPRREYSISAAGFWVQHGIADWVLTDRPDLRHERAPFRKGLLAWSVASSAVYAVAAFGSFGPAERDTRGMAESLGVREPWVGAMLIVPAVCDVWRYFDPQSAWARWLSRASKVGLVVIVARTSS
jgi:hypothetical protein